jgi:hypothetical protein
MKRFILLWILVCGVFLWSCSRYPWGEEKDGKKTRLTPINKKYVIGQPMMFKLQIANLPSDIQMINLNNCLILRDQDGNEVPYVTSVNDLLLRNLSPGAPTLYTTIDIHRKYLIDHHGKFTAQYRGDQVVKLPPSNIVTIDVLAGTLPVTHIIDRCLINVLPKNWVVHSSIVSQKELRGDKKLTEEYTFLISGASITAEDEFSAPITVWVIAPDTETFLGTLSSHAHDEYLGKSQWGEVYIKMKEKAPKLWPTAKTDIIKTLGIVMPITDWETGDTVEVIGDVWESAILTDFRIVPGNKEYAYLCGTLPEEFKDDAKRARLKLWVKGTVKFVQPPQYYNIKDKVCYLNILEYKILDK